MAIQKGIIRLSDKLGDLIFYRTKKGYASRNKPTTYKLSEGSKLAGKDFGEASRNASYIRKAFAPLVNDYADEDIINRLTKKLIDIFKTIPAANLGRKKLIDGNISLLRGFELNSRTALATLMRTETSVNILDKSYIHISLPKGNAKTIFPFKVPKANKACLNLMVFNFDLTGEDYEIIKFNELTIPFEEELEAREKKIPLILNGDKALIIAIGIHFKDQHSKIGDQRYKTCQIIYAQHIRDGVIVPFTEPTKIDQSSAPQLDDGLDWDIIE